MRIRNNLRMECESSNQSLEVVRLAIVALLDGLGLENVSLKEMWAKVALHLSLEVDALEPHKSEVT